MADDNMRIVPERDDPRPRARSSAKPTSSKSGGNSRPSRPAPKPVDANNKSSNSFLVILLCLFVVLLAGASAYLYLQTAELAGERDLLASRIADIESKLSVTDESLSQSGAALQAVIKGQSDELELHMAEIRKLWAVAYDRNRVAIEKLQADQKNADARMNSLASAADKLDPIVQGYGGIESRLETISTQLLVQSATVDELLVTDRDLSDQFNTLNSSVAKLNADLNTRSAAIDEIEEAIDAIDQYRLQVNQRLIRIEDGASAAP